MKLTIDSQEALVEALRPAFNNFGIFVDRFLKGWLTSKVPAFHHEMYGLLAQHKRLVVAAPRGFAKSTIISRFYPLWLALFKKATNIIIISASEDLAVGFLRDIKREIESNQLILTLWGDLRSDKWSENHIILKNGVEIRAKGAGSQIRGRRPDVIICDDLETDESVRSDDQRKQLKEWLFKACLNTLLPGGQFLIIGTIIHPLSVLADLLAVDNGWTKRKYQAYIGGEQVAGKELWGELWNHEALQVRKREIGSFAFASEFMNSPICDETTPIKEAQIRVWKELPQQYNAVIAVDPAYSEEENSDYKTACLILCDTQANRYLGHYIRSHSKIGEFQDAVINLWLQNKQFVTSIGIPNSGVEKGFFDSFLRKCEERKLYPPIAELSNSFTNSGTGISVRNKSARVIAALQPLFEQGKYYIGVDMLEARDELMSIGSSRHDDIVDAMAYAEQIIQPYGAGFTGETGLNDDYKPKVVGFQKDYGM